MKTITHVALSAALVLAAGAAAQAQTVITRPVQTETVVTTQGPLVLSPTERQLVYRNVVRERVVQQAPAWFADPRRALDRRIARDCADHQRAVADAKVVEIGSGVDVDEEGRTCEAEPHRGNQ